MIFKFMPWILILIFVGASSQGSSVDSSTELEFRIRKQVGERRYDDFYRRKERLEKKRQMRLKAAEEKKVERLAREKELEKARKSFVRKEPISDEAAQQLFEKRLAKKQAIRKKNRDFYARKKRELEALEGRQKSIPPKEEYDLKEPEEIIWSK